MADHGILNEAEKYWVVCEFVQTKTCGLMHYASTVKIETLQAYGQFLWN